MKKIIAYHTAYLSMFSAYVWHVFHCYLSHKVLSPGSYRHFDRIRFYLNYYFIIVLCLVCYGIISKTANKQSILK